MLLRGSPEPNTAKEDLLSQEGSASSKGRKEERVLKAGFGVAEDKSTLTGQEEDSLVACSSL